MATAVKPAGAVRHPATGISRVHLEVERRVAGSVRVLKQDDLLLLHFTVAHGHLPVAIRRELLDQTFLLPELNVPCQRVLATIPLGDAELLQGLQVRLDEVQVRAAGATCLIEATIRSAAATAEGRYRAQVS